MTTQVRAHWFDPLHAPWTYLGSNAAGDLRQDVYRTERDGQVWLRVERHPHAPIEAALADWTTKPQALDRGRQAALDLFELWRFVHEQRGPALRR